MHIQFDSITIEHFRSFNKKTEFHFSDGQPGLFFLKGRNDDNPALGPNGVGKSSIIDALLWCLYGKTVQGLRNPDITPWSGKGKTIVSLLFAIDNKQHEIVRTANPNSLELDGKEVGQDAIEKLFVLPFDVIPYTIILGQRQPLFFDLAPKAKLDLFMSVLNLERWERRSKHAQEKVDGIETVIQTLELTIDSKNREYEILVADITNLKQRSQVWEDERAQKLQSQEKERKTLEAQIESVINKRGTADLQLDRALTELLQLKPDLDKATSEFNKLRSTISTLERDQALRVREQDRLQDMIVALDKNETCPTCQQPLKSHAKVKQLKDDFKQQMDALDDTKSDKQLKVLTVALAELEASIKALQKAQRQFEDDERKARVILDELDPKIAQWQAQIKALTTLKEGQEDVKNPYKDQLQELRKRSEQNQRDLRIAEEKAVVERQQCERVRFWIKGFKEIRLYIIEEILQELELATNAMCEEFGLLGWSVCYDVERETKSGTVSRGLNVVVLSPNNKQAVKWECWSGGEGQRLRIIGALALSSVLLNHAGVTVDLEVLDEPTESLSSEGVRDLVDFLAQRAKQQQKQIWFVDHHTIESARFADVVTVVKNKQGSYIEGLQ